MLDLVRSVASLAILLWALGIVLLGLGSGTFLWILIGLVLLVVGAPMLGAHPWATARLYPRRGAIDPAAGR